MVKINNWGYKEPFYKYYTVGYCPGGLNVERIAFAVFRMMMASLAIGVIMGIVFKPRSWCQICPMGHATSLLK
jgi:hypothetical protein